MAGQCSRKGDMASDRRGRPYSQETDSGSPRSPDVPRMPADEPTSAPGGDNDDRYLTGPEGSWRRRSDSGAFVRFGVWRKMGS